MSLSEFSESEYVGRERRNSVRARAMLPCQVEKIDREQVMEFESLILDAAVLDSEYANLDEADWSERSDDLSREMVYVLNEIRALRQQLTDIRRGVEASSKTALRPRWLVLNDRGFWMPLEDDQETFEDEDLVKIRLQIPSLTSPNIIALGQVVRQRETPGKRGVAIEFRSISAIHSKAILRYALRRERQLARSKLFSSVNL
jgi:hypothetical protein